MKYFICFVCSLILSAILTPLVRFLALKTGFVVEARKDRWHKRPTPSLGGIAMVLSFYIPSFFLFDPYSGAVPLLIGGMLVFLLGLCDDLWGLTPQLKLVGQISITALLISMGVVVEIIPWPVIAVPVTFLWIVGLTNSFNLLDNMDGLSAGIAAICSLVLFVFSLQTGNDTVALISILMAGSCTGFLFYNFNPASIFMGDSGSMFLGFTLSVTALMGTWKHASSLFVALFVPLLILGIPIFDTVFVALMRRLRGQPVSQGGRDHVSHRLVGLGLSEKKTVVILYSLSAVFGLSAIFYNHINPFALAVCAVLGVVGLFYFGLFLGQREISGKFSDAQIASSVFKGYALRPLWIHLQTFVKFFIDLILIVVSYFSAYLLRFEGQLAEGILRQFVQTLPILIIVKIVVFYYFGLYKTLWRHAGVRDFINITKAVFVSSLICIAIVVMYSRFQYFSRAAFVVDALLTLFLISGARFSQKILKEYLESIPDEKGKRVLIIGAGDCGELALREIRNNPALHYNIVGFIDDDPFKRKKKIHGVSVLGGIHEMNQLARQSCVEAAIIAIASAPEETIEKIIRQCEQCALKWERFVPSGNMVH